MIEYVIDTRDVNGDAQAYADAVQSALQAFWKGSDVKVILVDYDVLNTVLVDYDLDGHITRLVKKIANEVRVKGKY